MGEDEPLPDVSLRKVKMAKAAMREVKLVGLTEVLVEESAVGLSEEEIAREQAWIKVCVREALGGVPALHRCTLCCRVDHLLKSTSDTSLGIQSSR